MRRQCGAAVRKHDVQAHAKVGQRTRPPDRITGGGSANHQTGGSQYARAGRLLDGLVDGIVQTEIIGGDD